MLEAAWEAHATNLANAPTTDALISALETLVQSLKIDLSKPARVVYARDTRPSGPALVASLEDSGAFWTRLCTRDDGERVRRG